MTYITIKNDHTLGARFLLLIVRLLGRNTADVAANRVLPNPPPEFEDWWDDTRSAQEIIDDIKGYQTGAV
jgi:hypothetical protein